MDLQGLDHVALYVRDQARAAAWYRDILGLERRHEDAWGDVPIVLTARDGTGVALFPAQTDAPNPVPSTRIPRVFAHVAFRASATGAQEARDALRARGIAFEEQDHGIARSLYFSDPDGHLVEVTTYEV